MAGELTFFEIGVEHPEAGAAFTGLFGWTFEPGRGRPGVRQPRRRSPGGTTARGRRGPYLFFASTTWTLSSKGPRARWEIEEMEMEGDEDRGRAFGRFKLCKDDQGARLRPSPAAEGLTGNDVKGGPL